MHGVQNAFMIEPYHTFNLKRAIISINYIVLQNLDIDDKHVS